MLLFVVLKSFDVLRVQHFLHFRHRSLAAVADESPRLNSGSDKNSKSREQWERSNLKRCQHDFRTPTSIICGEGQMDTHSHLELFVISSGFILNTGVSTQLNNS